MKTSRAFVVGGAAAAVLTTGWALTPKATDTVSYSASSTTGTTGSSTTSDSTGTTTTDSSSSTSGSTSSSSTTTGSSSTDTSTSTSTGTSTSSSSSDATYTGKAVQTRYGVYQVEITVSNGEVTDVTLVQEGSNDRESQQIKSYALPKLIQEVLDTQSSSVSYISGASYTSQGFANSVADAFSQAGL
ncbi:FMN-binding protein [Demequina capsici]|uniref:FMN-binding protein n=1 Tax=Demequina capsici TaxID=3075620 RepID=A0AA96F8W0_9MICO|nr:FMN-binding protein [Demequina sp. PMTSA13]WNM26316.1 FMN-binding protein [Demequina sp. PMTSA13]